MENKREKYETDMISRLPESVLHHILCFLSQKKALQTSVLSKSWRHLGPTRPVIELRGACEYDDPGHMSGVCENCFDGNEEAFISVLEKTFERYHQQNLFPHQLDLRMLRNDSQSISVLQKWIPIFISPALTTFRLSLQPWWNFDLPSVHFEAKSLRELCLEWCRLYENISIANVMLRNLQKLTLSKVDISDEALEKVISGCPLVKCLLLEYCKGFKTINIGSRNRCINYFHISCYYESSIEIEAPTLESIRIECPSNWHPNNSKNYFPHLKSLLLSHVSLSTDSFHYFSFNFPCLQELSLIYCSGFEEIDLSSRSINRLIIHESNISTVKKVAIEVPSILYFEFSSVCLPTTFSLTTSSKEWKSHLQLYSYVWGKWDDEIILQRILKLFELVKELSQSQISLTFVESHYLKIKQWDFNHHPVIVEHLSLNTNRLCHDSCIHFLNVLFRIFRPRYTSTVCALRKDYEEMTDFLWKTLINEREKTARYWEQHLEEVSIETSDEKEKVWHHVQWTQLQDNQKIRFRLKWRDQLVH